MDSPGSSFSVDDKSTPPSTPGGMNAHHDESEGNERERIAGINGMEN